MAAVQKTKEGKGNIQREKKKRKKKPVRKKEKEI